MRAESPDQAWKQAVEAAVEVAEQDDHRDRHRRPEGAEAVPLRAAVVEKNDCLAIGQMVATGW